MYSKLDLITITFAMMEIAFAWSRAVKSSLRIELANSWLPFLGSLPTDELNAGRCYLGYQSAMAEGRSIVATRASPMGRVRISLLNVGSIGRLTQTPGWPVETVIDRSSHSEAERTVSPAMNELFILRTIHFRLCIPLKIKVCRRGRQLAWSNERRKIALGRDAETGIWGGFFRPDFPIVGAASLPGDLDTRIDPLREKLDQHADTLLAAPVSREGSRWTLRTIAFIDPENQCEQVDQFHEQP